MLIEHIDAIARKKQRGVLFIAFHPDENSDDDGCDSWLDYNYKKDRRRKGVLKWFKDHGIHFQECGHIASESCMLPYLGNIYIDVAFDENDPQYQLVCKYLENPDGTPRNKRVRFYYLTDKCQDIGYPDVSRHRLPLMPFFVS